MLAIFNKKSDQLSWTRAAKLRRVILLLDEGCLRINEETQGADFLAPINGVGTTIKENKKTTVGKRPDADASLAAIKEETPEARTRAGGGDLILDTLSEAFMLFDGLRGYWPDYVLHR
jgi:hypothetical protein